MVHRKVGGCNLESQGITDIVHSLNQTIGIHIAVGTSSDTVGSLKLLFG